MTPLNRPAAQSVALHTRVCVYCVRADTRVGIDVGIAERAICLTVRHRGHHVQLNGTSARILAEDRDSIGAAAEVMYIVLDPFQRHHLVLQPGVAGRVFVPGVQESCKSIPAN